MNQTGLHVNVLKPARGDSSNGGVSSRCTHVTLVGDAVSGPFEPDETAPAVKLVKRISGGEVIVHAEPVDLPPLDSIGRWMFGGAYLAASDGRFSAALRKLGHSGYCAIPFHDRTETPEQYDRLSR